MQKCYVGSIPTGRAMENLDDFMCKCSPEGLAQCEEIYQWALSDLGCTAGDFINSLVYAMQWNLDDNEGGTRYGVINGFGCDMWCSANASIYTRNGDGWDEVKARVQCDKVEHGLARIWKWAKNDN